MRDVVEIADEVWAASVRGSFQREQRYPAFTPARSEHSDFLL